MQILNKMTSSTDPIERSWDLSLYELHRTPQEAITDETEIAVSARSLQSELTCPICLDMLTSTMTTKECLHRFCAECIITALRSGNKECPTCRKKLVSKRSLRPDPNFDQLVEKIFPNRDEYEAHQESILESLSKSHSQNFITSITHGIKAQMAHAKAVNRKKNWDDDDPENSASGVNTPITGEPRRTHGNEDDDDYEDSPVPPPPKKKKKLKPPTSISASGMPGDFDHGDDSNQSGSSGTASGTGDRNTSGGTSSEIEIVFKLHPNMLQESNDPSMKEVVNLIKDNATRYIKTTSKALVEHLCKYLAMRVEQRISFQIETMKKEPNKTTQLFLSNSGKIPKLKEVKMHILRNSESWITLLPIWTLYQVNEKYWKVNKPMEMFYSFKRT